VDRDVPPCPPPPPAMTISTEHVYEPKSTPVEVLLPEKPTSLEPIDRVALTSTPLLPPLMVELRASKDSPMQSPLQSPAIASPHPFSATNSPMVGTPQMPSLPSPPLSNRPSISSFHRPGHMTPSSDIPPLPMHDVGDEWAIKLGHANFDIFPEPYMPVRCDPETCRQLVIDWETARCNFVRHQVRTGEHYGITSKTYKLTEDKWAEIDNQWKKYHDAVVAAALPYGHQDLDSPTSPTQTAPPTLMSAIHGNNDDGKFPELGDEGIVGPMVQIASRMPYKQSRKTSLLRMFEDMKFPGSFLAGRGSTGIKA
jgi:hypothetical protein